ncbi:MAG: rod shape-determining protein MreD [Candidatus Moraniibacteriota bacterium]
MPKKIIYASLILLALLLQLSFLPMLTAGSMAGDAVLMLVLALAVLNGFEASLKWALVAGFLYDLASYATVGQHMLIFLLVAYGVSFFSRRLSVEVKGTGLLFLLGFVVLATFLSTILTAGFSVFSIAGGLKFLPQAFGSFSFFLLQTICNLGLLLFWYQILRKLNRIFL